LSIDDRVVGVEHGVAERLRLAQADSG